MTWFLNAKPEIIPVEDIPPPWKRTESLNNLEIKPPPDLELEPADIPADVMAAIYIHKCTWIQLMDMAEFIFDFTTDPANGNGEEPTLAAALWAWAGRRKNNAV